jgi:hypothetical protein
VKTAAALLDVNPQTVRDLVRAGVLTGIEATPHATGKKVYLLPAEVEAYGTGGVEGVVEFRKKQRGKAK